MITSNRVAFTCLKLGIGKMQSSLDLFTESRILWIVFGGNYLGLRDDTYLSIDYSLRVKIRWSYVIMCESSPRYSYATVARTQE